MKKFVTIILTIVMIVGLASCGQSKTGELNLSPEAGNAQIAMIQAMGEIDDKSFNQSVWEGISAYADKNGLTKKHYKPRGESDPLDTIKAAVDNGAEIIVLCGIQLAEGAYEAQNLYPEISFVMLDGVPYSSKEEKAFIGENMVAITFAEEQAGYLAGYGAVMDGYTRLGVLGGLKMDSVVRYGYGFVQGVDAAAKALGIEDIQMKYEYTETFDENTEVQRMAEAWYKEGTEVIFACCGGASVSVMKAAKSVGGKVIGVDTDQSMLSETVITSAVKNIGDSIQYVLAEFYSERFPGGQQMTLDAAQNGIQLPMQTSRFKTFSREDYEQVYSELVSGNISIQKEEVEEVSQLVLTNVNIVITE